VSTTSLSKSTNKLLQQRSGGPAQTLLAIRNIGSFVFNLAVLNRQDRISRMRLPVDERLGVPVSAWLALTLRGLIACGQEWSATPIGGTRFRMQRGDDGTIIELCPHEGCPCGFSEQWLLPCKHMIRLFDLAGEPFPSHLIGARWLGPDVPVTLFVGSLPLSLADAVIQTRLPSDEEGEDGESPLSPRLGGDVMRYKEVLTLGKQIAAGVSTMPDADFQRTVDRLHEILASISPGDVDVADARGIRKGRPRKAGNGQPRRAPACDLCAGPHAITDCQFYDPFKEEIENVAESGDPGANRCSCCLKRGHNKSSCPALRAARHRMQGEG
jgi:hypothetical protein